MVFLLENFPGVDGGGNPSNTLRTRHDDDDHYISYLHTAVVTFQVTSNPVSEQLAANPFPQVGLEGTLFQ